MDFHCSRYTHIFPSRYYTSSAIDLRNGEMDCRFFSLISIRFLVDNLENRLAS